MKQRIICKGLAVAVIVLFLGLAIQPSVAVQPEQEIEIEPKDYLFQTAIDIANNPEFKNLIKQQKNNLWIDIDRSVYHKILLRNPRLFFNMIFTKQSISSDYLDKCYNMGIEISKIIREDKIFDIMKSNKVADSELFNKISDIVKNDEVLNNKIETLKIIPSALLCMIGIIILYPLILILGIPSFIFLWFGAFFTEPIPFPKLANICIFISTSLNYIIWVFAFFAAIMCGVFSDTLTYQNPVIEPS